MGLLLAHWEVKVTVTEVSQGGATIGLLKSQRNGGLTPDKILLPIASLGTSFMGILRI